MSETIAWKGYLIVENHDCIFIQSPFVCNDKVVFGADSDATTMAIAGLQFMLSKGHSIESINLLPPVNAEIISLATGIDSPNESNLIESDSVEWNLLVGDEATLVIAHQSTQSYDFAQPIGVEIMDEQLLVDLNEAWNLETSPSHVSQGAYVSQSQYLEGARARLSLASQLLDNESIWPPRQMDALGKRLPVASASLEGRATVESWTKLSAAGAPSEFSLRAPILGGIQTVFVRFKQGPAGVFLLADDLEYQPSIGDQVEFSVRKIYAQESYIRYGLKALPI